MIIIGPSYGYLGPTSKGSTATTIIIYNDYDTGINIPPPYNVIARAAKLFAEQLGRESVVRVTVPQMVTSLDPAEPVWAEDADADHMII